MREGAASLSLSLLTDDIRFSGRSAVSSPQGKMSVRPSGVKRDLLLSGAKPSPPPTEYLLCHVD